jgi:CRISPR/Cas system-associated endonuclease Cas3-HD
MVYGAIAGAVVIIFLRMKENTNIGTYILDEYHKLLSVFNKISDKEPLPYMTITDANHHDGDNHLS